jgi:hypothetical protein
VSQPRDDRQDDLFGPRLEEIVNLRHPLVRLASENRLAVPGRTFQFGLSRRAGAANTADGRIVDHQAHAQPFR